LFQQKAGTARLKKLTVKGSGTAAPQQIDQMFGMLRDTIVAMVRQDGPDLSARQLGVFLTCYMMEDGHTVRGLAAELNVSKPAITRALDRLAEFGLARRRVDPMDRRSVLVQRTLKGAAFLQSLRGILDETMAAACKVDASTAENGHGYAAGVEPQGSFIRKKSRIGV